MRVAVLDDWQGVAASYADWSAYDVTFLRAPLRSEDEAVAALAGYDAVVAMRERTPFPRSLLARLPDLRLLVTTGMRNAAVDVTAARELGVMVCGTRSLAHPTAELTWALVLALSRHVVAEDAAVRAGGWQTTVGADLYGRTLAVLGLGRLGSRVAGYGRAFGMDVVAWSPNLTAERCAEAGARLVGREELFAAADVLTVHLVLGERTRGLVGAAELALMRRSAYLVNTSRGPIVDSAALAAALRAGAIAGAALDVYDAEPLPADDPLRDAPNLLLTPHLGYVTEDNYRTFYGDAVEDLDAFVRGEPARVLS